jgi:7-carboxy-7-deazaguanine synthase
VTGMLRVASLFGPTFQGEGPSAGQVAAFVRLSGCPVGCAWCDEPQTWDWSRFDEAAESRPMSVQQVLQWAAALPVRLVVITGGEPLIQQRQVAALAGALTADGMRVEVETSGTITPSAALADAVTAFNVSPKLAGSLVPPARRIRPGVLKALTASGKAVFKFVVSRPEELDEISELEASLGLRPVWVMPEGVTSGRVLTGMRSLADDVLARGWNLTGRMHILLWDGAGDR